ncbi:MarR family winged helix-turn-helix transcriptional regulator [Arthrobacter sp. MDT1-65]
MEGPARQATGTTRRAALDDVEQEAALICRSEQRVCRAVARTIDPAMEPAAYSVLAAARMLGPCRVTDLAVTLGMGTPWVSGHVAALQRLGLVERGAAGGDERSRPVVLTAEGARRIDDARQRRRRSFRRRLEAWDAADVVELVGLLSRFNAAYLTAQLPDAPVPGGGAEGLPGGRAGQ